MCAAKQNQTPRRLGRIGGGRQSRRVAEAALEHATLAAAAEAAAAAVGHQDVGGVRGVQNRPIGRAVEYFAARFDADLVNGVGDGIRRPADCACC